MIGLAFKGAPETDDIRESPALKIKKAMLETYPNIVFSYHDPLVRQFDDNNQVASSIEECAKDANVVMFLTNHEKITNVESKKIIDSMAKPCLIIDSWRNIKDHHNIPKHDHIKVFRIGIGRNEQKIMNEIINNQECIINKR